MIAATIMVAKKSLITELHVGLKVLLLKSAAMLTTAGSKLTTAHGLRTTPLSAAIKQSAIHSKTAPMLWDGMYAATLMAVTLTDTTLKTTWS